MNLNLSPSLSRRLMGVIALVASIFVFEFSGTAAESQKLVLAHYMPWYATKDVSGYWGWHWTMNHFKPDNIKANGQREAASHDYPQIGLYDSGDPHALECQVLQMKLSGIDGVIVDWYGIKDFNDYAAVHRNTLKLITAIKRAGLKFAICYEDQSIGHMVKGGKLTKENALAHGKEVFGWMEENWFSDPAYVKQGGRPLLLVFGPQYYDLAQWEELLGSLEARPLLHTLPHLKKRAAADGRYGWPPVTGGKTISPAAWGSYLKRLYAPNEKDSVIGVAFPGFTDIYEEAKLHETYGCIDERNGKTFSDTLKRAYQSRAKVIQIATWNDYGEGTVIEPTRRLGYRYLEEIQQWQRVKSNGALTFQRLDLRLPAKLYELRKRNVENPEFTKKLDEIAALLFSGKTNPAAEKINALKP